MLEEWQNERYRERLAGKTIFVTTEDHCYEVSLIGAAIREELRSTQEKADTRVLHMQQQQDTESLLLRQKRRMYLFSLWLSKTSSHVLCLSNAVNKLEQLTLMC